MFYRDTFVERSPGESLELYNLKLFLASYRYFVDHFSSRGIRVVVLSDDPDFLAKCKALGDIEAILSSTGEEYVTNMTEQFDGLVDKLCRVPFNEDKGKTICPHN